MDRTDERENRGRNPVEDSFGEVLPCVERRTGIQPQDDAALLPSRVHDAIGIDDPSEGEAMVHHGAKSSVCGELGERHQVLGLLEGGAGDDAV